MTSLNAQHPPFLHTAAEDIHGGRRTPVDLLEECLANIDRHETRVHAWVFVDRDRARADALRLTQELHQGQWRGPLHGIPIGVKDIIDVFDWPTAAGSRLWANSIARRDAVVVERMRRGGAVFVGKTVTTQYASFDPPPTRNPWDDARTPGGSSSGSAAALACGMCLGALGSQTGGSITRPASFCGVAGCKPTFGRVSLEGIVPLAPSLDHPGPMARCVKDLAILLEAMAGLGGQRSAVSGQRSAVSRDAPSSERSASQVDALKNRLPPRLGRLGGLFHERAEPAVREFMEHVCALFRARHAPVSAAALPATFDEVIPRHRAVMAVEAADYHGPRLERHPEDYAPKIRALLEEGLACPASEYARCLKHQRLLAHDILACFEEADVLLTAATPGPAPAADTTGDPIFNSPWSYTGLPTVSLPADWSSEGLPLAIQLIGKPNADGALLAAAEWCEAALDFQHRELLRG